MITQENGDSGKGSNFPGTILSQDPWLVKWQVSHSLCILQSSEGWQSLLTAEEPGLRAEDHRWSLMPSRIAPQGAADLR